MKAYKSFFEFKCVKEEVNTFIDTFPNERISKSKRKKMSYAEKIDIFSMFASMKLYSLSNRFGGIKNAFDEDASCSLGAICELEKRVIGNLKFVSVDTDDVNYFRRIQLSDDVYKTCNKISDTCFLVSGSEPLILHSANGEFKIKSISVSTSNCLYDMSSAHIGVNKWQRANSVRLVSDLSGSIDKGVESGEIDASMLESNYIVVHYTGERCDNGEDVFGVWIVTESSDIQDEFVETAIKGAFHIAMNEGCLVEQDYIEMPKVAATTRKAKVHKLKSPSKKIKKSPHYRNLRDERFYRGEYEKLERGTRWVPVNATIYNIEEV